MDRESFKAGYDNLRIAYPQLPEFSVKVADVWYMALEGFTANELEAGIAWYINNGRYAPKPVDIRKACFAVRERERRERGPQEERCPKCNSAGFFFVEADGDGPDAVLLCDCGRCISKDTPQRMRQKWATQLARALTDAKWELDKSGGIYRFVKRRRWIADPPQPLDKAGFEKAAAGLFPEF